LWRQVDITAVARLRCIEAGPIVRHRSLYASRAPIRAQVQITPLQGDQFARAQARAETGQEVGVVKEVPGLGQEAPYLLSGKRLEVLLLCPLAAVVAESLGELPGGVAHDQAVVLGGPEDRPEHDPQCPHRGEVVRASLLGEEFLDPSTVDLPNLHGAEG